MAVEQREAPLDSVIDDDDDVAIAAVTAAELLVGVALSDRRHAERRRSYVNEVLATIPIESYDLEVARAHASLLVHTRRSGRPRGAHDLLIAATAVARARTVISADPAGFSDLPGVVLRAA